jgi:hypothetical protein
MQIMTTLDVEAVQAFVLVADFQSFTRAAEALDTSQAAISMKLKRLEERLGEKLIERTPRLVRRATSSPRTNALLPGSQRHLAASPSVLPIKLPARNSRFSWLASMPMIQPC